MMILNKQSVPLQKLKEEREQTLQTLARLRQTLEAEIEPVIDDGDPGLEERERMVALMQNLSHRTEALDYAWQRAQKGVYGLCEQCGQPINPARLEALPEATRCIECKTY